MTATLAHVPTASDLAALPTADLRAELAKAIDLTARHLLYLARVWTELERRGEDLTGLRSGLVIYLPFIATGSVLPETVIRFAGNTTLLRAVSALPTDKQRRLADGEPVAVVERTLDGFTHRMLPAHTLNYSQVRQVFGDRVIRTVAEQTAALAATPATPKPDKAPRRGKVRADKTRGVATAGRMVFQPADLLAALADLATTGDEPPGEDAPSVSARLTPDEHARLKERAATGRTRTAVLIRQALRATGMI